MNPGLLHHLRHSKGSDHRIFILLQRINAACQKIQDHKNPYDSSCQPFCFGLHLFDPLVRLFIHVVVFLFPEHTFTSFCSAVALALFIM